jgi:hypothetical protein
MHVVYGPRMLAHDRRDLDMHRRTDCNATASDLVRCVSQNVSLRLAQAQLQPSVIADSRLFVS